MYSMVDEDLVFEFWCGVGMEGEGGLGIICRKGGGSGLWMVLADSVARGGQKRSCAINVPRRCGLCLMPDGLGRTCARGCRRVSSQEEKQRIYRLSARGKKSRDVYSYKKSNVCKKLTGQRVSHR